MYVACKYCKHAYDCLRICSLKSLGILLNGLYTSKSCYLYTQHFETNLKTYQKSKTYQRKSKQPNPHSPKLNHKIKHHREKRIQ